MKDEQLLPTDVLHSDLKHRRTIRPTRIHAVEPEPAPAADADADADAAAVDAAFAHSHIRSFHSIRFDSPDTTVH